MNDPFDLQRFVSAQNPVYDCVCDELRRGQKQGHWMWFIFPQLRGLGSSAMATKFGISSRQEAEAYLHHPILGPRLEECTRLVNLIEGRSSENIFGYPDDLKFRSSMTLFRIVAADKRIFNYALEKYFEGQADPRTIDMA
jgi:uncharacterized protein (DUF1810 family)